MERIYNKLVRDNIPNIIKEKGEEPITRILSDEEYKKELEKKLNEELKNISASPKMVTRVLLVIPIIFISIIYIIIAVSFIPYITYLRCKRQYSEYIFEQVQVYCTNTIMEFATTQAFVKSLEGVVESGILEEPLLSDVKTMIALSYEKGDVYDSIKYMDTKYPYYMVKNMHQLFLQVTKEGAKDTAETFENMLSDIDILVEGVYRDRTDRANFHRQFLTFGVALYGMVALIQLLIGQETYIAMVDNIFIRIFVHIIVIVNSCFLLNGEKYYNENVGAE